jgi:hypothetical protein
MGMVVSLQSVVRDPADVREMTLELTRALAQQPGLHAALEETPPPRGARGDMVTLGAIALSFISSGAAVALINTLKPFFERDRSLKVSVKTPDGREVTIDASHLKSDQVDQMTTMLSKLIGQ